MVTLILPGYSISNKKWLEETANQIPGDSEIRPVYWGHWTDPDTKFDPKIKANLLNGVAGKRVVDIVAKSIGTLAASYLIQKSPEKIRKVIFCGIPVNGLSETDKEVIKEALRKLHLAGVIIFQNSEDPKGSFNTVVDLLSEFGSKIKIVRKEADTHDYFYFNDFNRFLLD